MSDKCVCTSNNLGLHEETYFGSLLSSALDRGDWLLSRPGHFTPAKEIAVSIMQVPDPLWMPW
jgi:hypothetical protein